ALGVEAVHEVSGGYIGRGRIAGDASDRCPGRTLPVLIEDLEDGVLDGVVELRAPGGEEFDPVVGHRVVRGGDDDAEGRPGVLDHLGDARGREHAGVEHVDPGRGDAGAERGGEELSGHACVTPDDREGSSLAGPAAAEYA